MRFIRSGGVAPEQPRCPPMAVPRCSGAGTPQLGCIVRRPQGSGAPRRPAHFAPATAASSNQRAHGRPADDREIHGLPRKWLFDADISSPEDCFHGRLQVSGHCAGNRGASGNVVQPRPHLPPTRTARHRTAEVRMNERLMGIAEGDGGVLPGSRSSATRGEAPVMSTSYDCGCALRDPPPVFDPGVGV